MGGYGCLRFANYATYPKQCVPWHGPNGTSLRIRSRSRKTSPADRAVVDCGIYVEGQRLPGMFTTPTRGPK